MVETPTEKIVDIKEEDVLDTFEITPIEDEKPITPPWILDKTQSIKDACAEGNLKALRALSLSKGGLLTDSLRQQAWPILLGDGDIDGVAENEKPTPWQSLPVHPDEGQVDLDVNRSFVYYPTDKSDSELKSIKQELSDLITEVLRCHPYLHYFQGYHDICQVLLLVLPPELRAPCVRRLSLFRIRDFMLPTIQPTISQLHLIPDLLKRADPELFQHLAGIDPFYALAGTLTMYAHEIERYSDISRLFDAFLATSPAFSVYMFAQIILSRRKDLLEIPADSHDMLHFVLSKLPHPLDLDALISGTKTLLKKYPPKTLPAWRYLSSVSCLKTYKKQDATLEDAERWMTKQISELQWQEWKVSMGKTLWKYRKPAQLVGTAVAVGLLAVYLKKNPASMNVVSSIVNRVVL